MTPTVSRLQIFISWSGDRSEKIGKAFAEFLPDAVNAVEPFISASNVDKGSRWGEVLKDSLHASSCAIVCLTPDSLKSIWVAFETGAISRATGGTERARARIWTYLLGVDNGDLQLSPFAEYQSTASTEVDTFRLVDSINRLSPDPVSSQTLKRRFDKVFWPSFSGVLATAEVNMAARESSERAESEKDLFAEILRTLRSIQLEIRAPNNSAAGSPGVHSYRLLATQLLNRGLRTPISLAAASVGLPEPVLSVNQDGTINVQIGSSEFALQTATAEKIIREGDVSPAVREYLVHLGGMEGFDGKIADSIDGRVQS